MWGDEFGDQADLDGRMQWAGEEVSGWRGVESKCTSFGHRWMGVGAEAPGGCAGFWLGTE